MDGEKAEKVKLELPCKPWKYREFVCGWGAATVNILVTFPLNKVIFRQMLHNVTPLDAAKQIANEGASHLYRGVVPPLLQKSVSVSIMFGVYDKCQKPLVEKSMNPVLATVIASVAAGTIESILVPFERIQTLLQNQRYHKEVQNMKDAVRIINKQHGFKEFYRGLVPVLFRNGPSNAVFFLLRDEAKSRIPEPKTIPMTMLHQFTIGALIGAFCSSIFYPCNVIKVHMQSRLGGDFQSIPSAVREIYLERGSVRAFFRGVHLNYTRSCISWGVINVAYEGLKKVL